MKPTRILLADAAGVLGETVLNLPQVVRNLSLGPCTVRSAGPAESISRWNPDLVLMDAPPARESSGSPAASDESGGGPRKVVMLTLSYEEDPAVVTAGARGRLTSATVQLIDLPDGDEEVGGESARPVAIRRAAPVSHSQQHEFRFVNPAGAAGSPRWLMWKPAPRWRVRLSPRTMGESWQLRLASNREPKHESE